MQRWIHEITGSPIPQGWDSQLSNEPLLNAYYQYNRRLSRGELARDFDCDLAVNGGVFAFPAETASGARTLHCAISGNQASGDTGLNNWMIGLKAWYSV